MGGREGMVKIEKIEKVKRKEKEGFKVWMNGWTRKGMQRTSKQNK